MANLNLGQDVAKKENRYKRQNVAKSYPLYQAIGMCRHASLININPSYPNYTKWVGCCSSRKKNIISLDRQKTRQFFNFIMTDFKRKLWKSADMFLH